MPAMNRIPDNHPYADALIRRFELLLLLSRNEHTYTIADIRGLHRFSDIPERMLQRDLKYIKDTGKFGLKVQEEQKPYKWSMKKAPGIAGVSDIESVSLALFEKEIRNLLPQHISHEYTYSCDLSRERLQKMGKGSALAAWIDKVRTVPAAIPLMEPVVKEDIKSTVYEALFNNTQLEIKYNNYDQSVLSYTGMNSVNPLGLVQQGNVMYLVISEDKDDSIHVLALHRIQSAKSVFCRSKTPANFSLDGFIANGGLGCANTLTHEGVHGAGYSKIDLTAIFKEYSGEYLLDQKLSEDQKVTRMGDGKIKISAKVPNTPVLIQWLCGFGANVEILKPGNIKETVLKFYLKALQEMKPGLNLSNSF